jgi:hypothetical protein
LIRQASDADLPRLLELARVHHAKMTGLPPLDDDSFLATARAAIASDTAVILMTDGGSICGQVHPFYFNRHVFAGVEFWWHAEDNRGRETLRAFEEWARDAGAGRVVMSGDATHRPEALQRVLRACGYGAINFSMSKEIG